MVRGHFCTLVTHYFSLSVRLKVIPHHASRWDFCAVTGKNANAAHTHAIRIWQLLHSDNVSTGHLSPEFPCRQLKMESYISLSHCAVGVWNIVSVLLSSVPAFKIPQSCVAGFFLICSMGTSIGSFWEFQGILCKLTHTWMYLLSISRQQGNGII